MYSAVIDWYPNVYTGANESYTYIPTHTFSITTVVECSSNKV
jgi:hypothetical protein